MVISQHPRRRIGKQKVVTNHLHSNNARVVVCDINRWVKNTWWLGMVKHLNPADTQMGHNIHNLIDAMRQNFGMNHVYMWGGGSEFISWWVIDASSKGLHLLLQPQQEACADIRLILKICLILLGAMITIFSILHGCNKEWTGSTHKGIEAGWYWHRKAEREHPIHRTCFGPGRSKDVV